MIKYCPVCSGEFQSDASICPKDDTALLNKKPQSFERMLDIYAAKNEIEAERILALLSHKQLRATRTAAGISQVPVVSDTQYIISVDKDHVDVAKGIIERAREDGIISVDGNFL